jgi:hypothetical protein
MKEMQARQILRALIQGVHPSSGMELPSGTVLQEANVLRALLVAVKGLELEAARAQRRSRLPSNSGRIWTAQEEAALLAAFQAGDALQEIATRHGRSLRAVEDRLEKLGLITPAARTTERTWPRRAQSAAESDTAE